MASIALHLKSQHHKPSQTLIKSTFSNLTFSHLFSSSSSSSSSSDDDNNTPLNPFLPKGLMLEESQHCGNVGNTNPNIGREKKRPSFEDIRMRLRDSIAENKSISFKPMTYWENHREMALKAVKHDENKSISSPTLMTYWEDRREMALKAVKHDENKSISSPNTSESISQGIKRKGDNATNSTRWSEYEDHALASAICDFFYPVSWKMDNGNLSNGAYDILESLLRQKIPKFEKKAKPHIQARVKLLRKQYDAIVEIRSSGASGFQWDDSGNYFTCPDSVWDEWIKLNHKNAKGLRNKPFPYFDKLGKIFGNDRVVGNESTNVFDVLDEVDGEERGEEEQEGHQPNVEEIGSAPSSNPTESSPSTTPYTSMTRKARTETIEVLEEISTKLGKISDVMELASGHIGRLANCFQHESDSAQRRMNVTSEVMKIEGLTSNEVIIISRKISLNPLEVDFFFGLPDNYKSAYVQGLLHSY